MKRASRKTKAAVGAFITASAAVLAMAVMSMGDDLRFFKPRKTYVSEFTNADGLAVGSPVRVGGVDIGRVEAIGIDMKGVEPVIRVQMTVHSPYDALVRAQSTVSTDTQGVLGDKFLALNPGPQNVPALPEGGSLPARDRDVLKAVVDRSGAIVADVEGLARAARMFADALPDKAVVEDITTNLRRTSQSVEKITRMLGSDESAVAYLSELSTRRKVEQAIDDLVSASESVRSVARKIDSGDGTLGAFVNDVSLYDDVKEILGRANRSRVVRSLLRSAISADSEGGDAPAMGDLGEARP